MNCYVRQQLYYFNNIDTKECSILATENDRLRRKIKEAIKIFQQAPQINRDSGNESPPIFRDFLSRNSSVTSRNFD